MTWWTTWKQLAAARPWGIAASLATLVMPLMLILRFHQRLNNAIWTLMALTLFALISYARPQDKSLPTSSRQGDPDDIANS
jgi:4-amino-4-deoxy-L-arabinose transferase-like glycosyltransferase